MLKFFILTSVSVFISLQFANAEANPLPSSDMTVAYKCSKGPTQERIIRYNMSSETQGFYREFWFTQKNQSTIQESGSLTGWTHILGLPAEAIVRVYPRFISAKSGTLTQLISLKPGTYTGDLEIMTSSGTWIAKVTTEIGKRARKTTALGSTYLIPINTEVKNHDGAKGVLKINSEYSPTFRFHLSQSVVASNTAKTNDFLEYQCEATGARPIKEKPESVLLEWPKKGTVLNYSCDGSLKELQLEVLENEGPNKVELGFRELSAAGKRKTGTVTGSAWKLYVMFFDLLKGPNGKNPLAGQVNLEKQTDFSKKVFPQFHSGEFYVVDSKSKREVNKFLFFIDAKEQLFPTTNGIGNPIQSAMYDDKGLVFRAMHYNSQIKAPYRIIRTILNKMGRGRIRYDCQLQIPPPAR